MAMMAFGGACLWLGGVCIGIALGTYLSESRP